MGTDQLIDFEEFLRAFGDDDPAGEDLRADYSPTSAYFEIKDAQSSARTDERRRRESFEEVMDTDFSLNDWKSILTSAQAILRDRSKDLEIASWHVEALLRVHGFAGLRDGFHLLRKLASRFWDDIHPRPDEDGLETTVAPVTALSGEEGPGTLIWPISNVPIFQTQSWGAWQCRQAQSLEGVDDSVLKERISEGAISPEMLRAAVQATQPDHFRSLVADIEQAIEAVTDCEQVFNEKCRAVEGGYEFAPSTRNIVQALNEVLSAIRSVAAGIDLAPQEEVTVAEGEATDTEHVPAEVSGHQALAPQANQPLVSGTAGIVQTRDQAFHAIQEIADHFKKTEPHSPVSYLLEQAVRWGRLPLPHLLNELVYDQQMKDDLFRMMGMSNSNETP